MQRSKLFAGRLQDFSQTLECAMRHAGSNVAQGVCCVKPINSLVDKMLQLTLEQLQAIPR